MNQVIQNIDNVNECDVVIAKLQERLTELNFKKTVEVHRKNKLINTAQDVAQNLAEATEKLDEVTARIAELPDGLEKETLITEQYRLHYRKRQLTSRNSNVNVIEQMDAESDLATYSASILVLEQLLADAEAQKATLQAA
jgi:uncharacterized protein YydD (DUF2326 family)